MEAEKPVEAAAVQGGITPLGSFRLTGYCSCRICSEGYGRKTASGKPATAGRTVAVDTRVIPLGTKLLIEGKEYIAEDIGGAVKHNHIDIYFDTHRQAQSVYRYAEVYRIG